MGSAIEINKRLQEKLNYIGLNLEKIPSFLKEYEALEFKPIKLYDEKQYCIYKYIPIDKIQILITPVNKQEEIRKRYLEALPIYSYMSIRKEDEENINRYSHFLNMLKSITETEIEEIEKEQEILNKYIPFEVKYLKNYLWQIYYSAATDKYFMLVSSDDFEFSHLFYLLKKQIEFAKNKTKDKKPISIFVPINNTSYSRNILNKNEVSDIENSLWLFTNEWAKIYEVFDKEEKQIMYILGEMTVYEGVKTKYRVVLQNRDEALKFYKSLRVLFILKTEIPNYFNFSTKIDKNNNLDFYYNDVKVDFDNLSSFIKKQYTIIKTKLEELKGDDIALEKKLEKLKEKIKSKDIEFNDKQKEISTYLEYKKTFIGKIKYFFKSKKNKSKLKDKIEENVKSEEIKLTSKDSNIDQKTIELILEEKDFYSIEDIIIIYSAYDKKTKYIKNLEIDIKALELRIKSTEKKIENAIIYINEIDNHKKSIFEFWKFANKDEQLVLAEGAKQENTGNNIKKFFDYKTELEELGMKIDKIQRSTLSKKEIDIIFIAKTEILDGINIMRKNKKIDKDIKKLNEIYNKYKELIENNSSINEFDRLITTPNAKESVINNKKHREAMRSELVILDMYNETTIEEFKTKLEKFLLIIEEAINKIQTPYNMSIYKVTERKINKEDIGSYTIDPNQIFNSYYNNKSDKLNLYKVNIQEGMPAVFYSNIMFYNNLNNTLPLGMNLSTDILIDEQKYKFKLINEQEILINISSDDDIYCSDLKTKIVTVYEYDLILKEDKNQKEDEEENL